MLSTTAAMSRPGETSVLMFVRMSKPILASRAEALL